MTRRGADPVRPDPGAWYLPGFDAVDPACSSGWFEGASAAGRAFRSPALTVQGAAQVAERVEAAALKARRERKLDQVVQAISQAAGVLADPTTEPGSEAVRRVGDELGWPAELARETLFEMGRTWGEEALWGVLREELGDTGLLDGFRRVEVAGARDAGRRRRASGPPLLLQVVAGNVPGVAVTGVIRGLLVRSGVLTKLPEDEPGLVVLFARQLEAVDSALAASVAATWWPTEEVTAVWEEWSRRAATLVVYGGEAAVDAVRSRARADQQVVVYGPKLGIGVVLPGACLGDAAAGLARDVCAYEQQGCVSPRLVFTLGSAEDFAAELGVAFSRETQRIPRPELRPEEAVAIRSMRSEVEFRGYGGGASRFMGSEDDLSWTVLVDDAPALDIQPLPRVVRLAAAPTIQALATLLRPLAGRIQALGYAGDGGMLESLAEAAAELGVSRVAPLGRIAWPPPDWRHDGRHQLLPLLEWTDWETG